MSDRRARYVSPLPLYFLLSLILFALAPLNSSLVARTAHADPAAVDISLDPEVGSGIDLRWPWLQQRLPA